MALRKQDLFSTMRKVEAVTNQNHNGDALNKGVWPPPPDKSTQVKGKPQCKRLLINKTADLAVGFLMGSTWNIGLVYSFDFAVKLLKKQAIPQHLRLILFDTQSQALWVLVLIGIINSMLDMPIRPFRSIFLSFYASFWLMALICIAVVLFPAG